ncbi:MAG: topoisomerase C-terminal repeat-containing protein [Candidatus Angelobacter sp.]
MIVSPINGKQLTGEHIRQLITAGRTSLVKGFRKKKGMTIMKRCLVLTDEFKIRLEV